MKFGIQVTHVVLLIILKNNLIFLLAQGGFMGGQGRQAKSSIIEHRLEIWCTGSSFATIYLECEES